ncbi:FERM domain and FERM, N-terminal domain and Band 4.1 domain-containing protein [Strongyloides ratti]|uniref:FERM domain and FERM, N-terminal domain and Band 4.1 domain-containing protein n=1 Tax=Strongyloides ratti TaxID=34506 RepID=A0A090L1D4_STRRB|nr:FERM domain and FERM, N-terminal domain and Band 4.1 domain-containing protein [Strongyloides ratti]CEF61264.1 FERM domain and FERM, N-terminal domain and Band 4.1 domain-containing protein [Strongyloides ratti]
MSFLFDGLQIFTPYFNDDDSEKDETFLNVSFLDGSTKSMRISKKATGGKVCRRVLEYLNIIDTEFFGLMVKSRSRKLEENSSKDVEIYDYKNWEWINEKKKVYQMIPKNAHGLCVLLRVKFFPINPSKVADCFSRRLIFLDIKEKMKSGVWSFDEYSKSDTIEIVFLAVKAFDPTPISCNNTQQFVKVAKEYGDLLMIKKGISFDDVLRESIRIETSFEKLSRYYENSPVRLFSNINKDTYVLEFLKKVKDTNDYGSFVFNEMKNKYDTTRKIIINPLGIYVINGGEENQIFKGWSSVKSITKKGRDVKISFIKDMDGCEKVSSINFCKKLVDAKNFYTIASGYHKHTNDCLQKIVAEEERMRTSLKSRHASMDSDISNASNFSTPSSIKNSARNSIVERFSSIRKRFSSNTASLSMKLRGSPLSSLSSRNFNGANDSGVFNDSVITTTASNSVNLNNSIFETPSRKKLLSNIS